MGLQYGAAFVHLFLQPKPARSSWAVPKAVSPSPIHGCALVPPTQDPPLLALGLCRAPPGCWGGRRKAGVEVTAEATPVSAAREALPMLPIPCAIPS